MMQISQAVRLRPDPAWAAGFMLGSMRAIVRANDAPFQAGILFFAKFASPRGSTVSQSRGRAVTPGKFACYYGSLRLGPRPPSVTVRSTLGPRASRPQYGAHGP